MNGYYSPSDNIFRNILRASKPGKRVFISFHMNDLKFKKFIIEQAKSDRFDLEFTNYSVNEPFDEKWKTQCKERLKKVSAIICLIGEDTWSRLAVDWELKTSYELDKQIFGVRIFRDKNHIIPKQLRDHRAKILQWNIKDIVRELDK